MPWDEIDWTTDEAGRVGWRARRGEIWYGDWGDANTGANVRAYLEAQAQELIEDLVVDRPWRHPVYTSHIHEVPAHSRHRAVAMPLDNPIGVHVVPVERVPITPGQLESMRNGSFNRIVRDVPQYMIDECERRTQWKAVLGKIEYQFEFAGKTFSSAYRFSARWHSDPEYLGLVFDDVHSRWQTLIVDSIRAVLHPPRPLRRHEEEDL